VISPEQRSRLASLYDQFHAALDPFNPVARHQRRLLVHESTRRQLRQALAALIPGQRVIVFGSLTRPGVFNDRSDVDLALETEPPGCSALRLMGELSERLERPVDVILLSNCRFRELELDPEKLALILKYARLVTDRLPALAREFIETVAREHSIEP
jgi:predicted nucleotidyltransferase